MALTPSEKFNFAWEFLRRNPRYVVLWSKFVEADRKANNNLFTSLRTRKRGTTLPREHAKIIFRRQFLEEFGIANFFDPQWDRSARELSKVFCSIKPAAEFPPGIEQSENRLYLSIDPSASQRDIMATVREIVGSKQKLMGTRPRFKFPRGTDLNTYLTILDSYKKFQRPETGKSPKINCYWTKFADFLNLKLNRKDIIISPEELARTLLPQAIQVRDGAPFSILKNYK